MFFEEITLSKKSWHYKLMSATFYGNPPNLWSFCPYFWLTIFCILVSPFTLFTHLVGVWPVKGMFKFYESRLMTRFENWIDSLEENRYCDLVDDYEFEGMPKVRGLGAYKRRYLALERICNKQGVKIWTNEFENEYTPEFYQLLDKWREENKAYRLANHAKWEAERDANHKREMEEYRASQLRKEKLDAFFKPFEKFGNWIVSLFTITKVVVWTKRIVSTLITAGGLYLLYILGKLWYDYASIRPVDWALIKQISIVIGFIIAGILVIIGLVFVISILVDKLKASDSKKIDRFFERVVIFFERISPPFIVIGRFFIWLFKVIIKPFHFFILYFKAWKSDNCPAINWKEENA